MTKNQETKIELKIFLSDNSKKLLLVKYIDGEYVITPK